MKPYMLSDILKQLDIILSQFAHASTKHERCEKESEVWKHLLDARLGIITRIREIPVEERFQGNPFDGASKVFLDEFLEFVKEWHPADERERENMYYLIRKAMDKLKEMP